MYPESVSDFFYRFYKQTNDPIMMKFIHKLTIVLALGGICGLAACSDDDQGFLKRNLREMSFPYVESSDTFTIRACVQLPLLLPGTYRKHRLRLLRSRPESGHRKALLARSAHEHQRGDRSPPGQMPRGLFAELPARVLPPRDQRTDGDCAEHGRKPYLPCPEATAGKIVEIGANSAAVFHFFTK